MPNYRDIRNLLGKKSLRASMIAIIVLMGIISAALVAISENVFRNLVHKSERSALTELVELKVSDILKEHFAKTKSLGLSMQLNKELRTAIKTRNHIGITEFLNSQFHQYFVTAGIIDLKKLYILDNNYTYITESTDSLNEEKTPLPCEAFLVRAKQRKNSEKLKPLSGVCRAPDRSTFATIIPVGSLRPFAYLLIMTDVAQKLISIENDLGMLIRLRYFDKTMGYQSEKWPDSLKTEDHVSILHRLMSKDKNEVLLITVARNVTEFQQEWENTAFYVKLVSFVLIIFAVIGSLWVLRNGLNPLKHLRIAAEQLSKGVYTEVPTTTYPEIDIPIQSFNKMAKTISSLIKNLELEIGERKAVESEIKKHRNHLEELIEERTSDLAIARDQAMAASTAKTSFLANMSHELRTPLNAIIGYSEILQEDIKCGNTENITDDLDKINHSGKFLLSLISDILDLSKIEAGKMELDYTSFEILPFIEEVVFPIQPLIQDGNNTFKLVCDNDIGMLRADSTKLRQAIANLLSNACKFTKNGEVTLEVFKETSGNQNWVSFSVVDTGIGIPVERQDELWKEFTQADSSTTRKFGGTGLGLSISQKYCEMMGGTITVTSEEGKGSNFTIKLPDNAHVTDTGIENVNIHNHAL